MRTVVRRLLFFTGLIVTWEIAYHLFWTHLRLVPYPSGVAVQLYRGFFETGILTYALADSLQRIAIGYVIAVIVGAALGILLARSKLADETIGSLVIALQPIPSIVWLPIAAIVFGFGTPAIVFVVALGGTWAMIQNMRMGINNVQPLLIRAARTMGYKGSELVWKVMIPASVPAALAGARLAWAFGWRALLAAELIGTGGLGRTLMDARDFFNMNLVVAIMVIISIFGLIVEYFIFSKVERKVMSRYGLKKYA